MRSVEMESGTSLSSQMDGAGLLSQLDELTRRRDELSSKIDELRQVDIFFIKNVSFCRPVGNVAE